MDTHNDTSILIHCEIYGYIYFLAFTNLQNYAASSGEFNPKRLNLYFIFLTSKLFYHL